MKKNFDTADHLWLESFRSLTKNGGTKSFDGYTARLTDVDKCFTWNNGLQMDALKACSKLLFLLDFSYDGAFIKAYDHFAEVDEEGNAVNAYGPVLRDQLSTAIHSLRTDSFANYVVLSPWEGVESQQAELFLDSQTRADSLLTAQFLYDGDKLNLFTNWRSIDIWNELPYNLFVWSNLLSLVAGYAEMEVGFIQIQSAEVYVPQFLDKLPQRYALSEGQYDKVPGIGLNHKGLGGVKDPIHHMECGACLEELMRSNFSFGKRFGDITKSEWKKKSSVTTALTAIYAHWAILALETLPKQDEKTLLTRIDNLIGVLGDYADTRLIENVACFLNHKYIKK
tara:strand:+ start:849 stop:1865 length:1017 start_codon:yes stop_codon:yes gene_type:complete